MLPTIENGSYALFFFFDPLKMSTKYIYKIFHPSLGLIIKRFKCIDDSGYLWFEGDSKESTSSSKIGKINRNQVLGRIFFVISRYKIKFL
jgi:hypothetical protein